MEDCALTLAAPSATKPTEATILFIFSRLLNHPRSSATLTTIAFYLKSASTVKLFFISQSAILRTPFGHVPTSLVFRRRNPILLLRRILGHLIVTKNSIWPSLARNLATPECHIWTGVMTPAFKTCFICFWRRRPAPLPVKARKASSKGPEVPLCRRNSSRVPTAIRRPAMNDPDTVGHFFSHIQLMCREQHGHPSAGSFLEDVLHHAGVMRDPGRP